jgi:hypothetical protein
MSAPRDLLSSPGGHLCAAEHRAAMRGFRDSAARKRWPGSIGRDLPFFFKTVRSSSGEETQETKAYFKLEHMLKDVRLSSTTDRRSARRSRPPR